IHLHLASDRGAEIDDDAAVVLEAIGPEGLDAQRMFEGTYREFKAARDHTLPAQTRGVAKNDYAIRLAITVPALVPEPDLEHEDSTFEIKCFKYLFTLSA